MLSLCFTAASPKLILFTPDMRELARLELPQRPSAASGDISKTSLDSSGVYFYLDANNRVIISDANRNIRIIEIHSRRGKLALNTTKVIDLKPTLARFAMPQGALFPENPVTGVMPDFEGNLWWVTRYGVVGILAAGWSQSRHPQIEAMQLRTNNGAFEEIQNGMAGGRDGVYVISDHALYRFASWAQRTDPTSSWRWSYEPFRGSHRKPSMYNQGSGTTPTLFDDAGQQFVAIADNHEPQMNVWVLDRQQGQPVCAVPVFTPGRSATENSLTAENRSILVSNTYGHTNILADKLDVEPGIARIEVRAELGSCRRFPNCYEYPCSEHDYLQTAACCEVVWENRQVVNTAVTKLALQEPQMVYIYTSKNRTTRDAGVDWYLTALDYRDGKVRFDIPIGGGGYRGRVWGKARALSNNTSPVVLAPDGAAYVGVFDGLARITDSDPYAVRN